MDKCIQNNFQAPHTQWVLLRPWGVPEQHGGGDGPPQGVAGLLGKVGLLQNPKSDVHAGVQEQVFLL